jgi:hypothetical protein
LVQKGSYEWYEKIENIWSRFNVLTAVHLFRVASGALIPSRTGTNGALDQTTEGANERKDVGSEKEAPFVWTEGSKDDVDWDCGSVVPKSSDKQACSMHKCGDKRCYVHLEAREPEQTSADGREVDWFGLEMMGYCPRILPLSFRYRPILSTAVYAAYKREPSMDRSGASKKKSS